MSRLTDTQLDADKHLACDKTQQVGQKPRKKMIAAFHFDNFALECLPN